MKKSFASIFTFFTILSIFFGLTACGHQQTSSDEPKTETQPMPLQEIVERGNVVSSEIEAEYQENNYHAETLSNNLERKQTFVLEDSMRNAEIEDMMFQIGSHVFSMKNLAFSDLLDAADGYDFSPDYLLYPGDAYKVGISIDGIYISVRVSNDQDELRPIREGVIKEVSFGLYEGETWGLHGLTSTVPYNEVEKVVGRKASLKQNEFQCGFLTKTGSWIFVKSNRETAKAMEITYYYYKNQIQSLNDIDKETLNQLLLSCDKLVEEEMSSWKDWIYTNEGSGYGTYVGAPASRDHIVLVIGGDLLEGSAYFEYCGETNMYVLYHIDGSNKYNDSIHPDENGNATIKDKYLAVQLLDVEYKNGKLYIGSREYDPNNFKPMSVNGIGQVIKVSTILTSVDEESVIHDKYIGNYTECRVEKIYSW